MQGRSSLEREIMCVSMISFRNSFRFLMWKNQVQVAIDVRERGIDETTKA